MIRDLVRGNMAAVCDLLRATQNAHAEQHPRVYRSVDQYSELLMIIETQIARPDAIALCYENDGKVVGYFVAIILDIAPDGILVPRRIAMLNEIAVREEYRGQGIADGLMEEMIKRAEKRGASALRASHAVFNQASAKLLKRHGLSPVSMMLERDL